MNITFTQSFQTEDGAEFDCEFTASIVNNGIGHYEFWGHKCFDGGVPTIDEITFDADPMTAEQEAIAQAAIDSGDLDAKVFELAADMACDA